MQSLIAVIVGGFIVWPALVQAQSNDSITALNRQGRWSEAAAAAQALLRSDGEPAQKCETRAILVYALSRLGRLDEVREQAAAFDSECGVLPDGHWARREVDAARPGDVATSSIASSEVAIALSKDGGDGEGDWQVASASTLGVDTTVLREHRTLCARTHADACLVVRKGAIVDEWYGPRYVQPIGAMSSTKSVTGLLIGILEAQGRLSVDDPVARWLPEWRAGAEAGVTIRHLLAMTSGLPDERKTSDVGHVRDKEALVFGLGVPGTPGGGWAYTNNGAFLLSPIIKRAAGEPVADFAERVLFAPLGMRNTRFHVYPDGQAWTHADLQTTPRDLARLGQVMLDGGRWRDAQVVPAEWVRASTVPSQRFHPYGLLWWLDVDGGFAARGYLDTNLYVFPDRELVVVRMQARPAGPVVPYDAEAQRLFKRLVPGP